MASVRRRGVRADGVLKDGDNLIQRYRKLQGRADALRALKGEVDRFMGQADRTRTWIADLVGPLASPGAEERKRKARVNKTFINYTKVNKHIRGLKMLNE